MFSFLIASLKFSRLKKIINKSVQLSYPSYDLQIEDGVKGNSIYKFLKLSVK